MTKTTLHKRRVMFRKKLGPPLTEIATPFTDDEVEAIRRDIEVVRHSDPFHMQAAYTPEWPEGDLSAIPPRGYLFTWWTSARLIMTIYDLQKALAKARGQQYSIPPLQLPSGDERLTACLPAARSSKTLDIRKDPRT